MVEETVVDDCVTEVEVWLAVVLETVVVVLETVVDDCVLEVDG